MGYIGQIMGYCKNHFIRHTETDTYSFDGAVITGAFSNTYIAGMYLLIEDSFANDGIYKIEAVTTTSITVDSVLDTENTGETVRIYGLNPGKEFLSIVEEIDAADINEGIASESIDDYSVSYGNSGDGGMFARYGKRLSQFRKAFDDRARWRDAVWQSNITMKQ